MNKLNIKMLEYYLRFLVCSFIVLSYGYTDQVRANPELQQGIHKDIKVVQREIDQQQKRHREQLAKLNQRLTDKTVRVEQLRKKVAAATRATDESSLGIDALRSRVKIWEDQDSYQSHLVSNFLGKHSKNLRSNQFKSESHKKGEQSFRDSLITLDPMISQVSEGLSPVWEDQDVIADSGAVITAATLHVGPVYWYLKGNDGGLLNRDETGNLITAISFSSDSIAELRKIKETGAGEILLDPTLGKVQQYLSDKETLLKHIQKGGVWVVPIFAFAILSLIIAVLKGIQLWRLPKVVPMVPERVSNIVVSKDDITHLGANLDEIYRTLVGTQRELLKITMETHSHPERDDLLVSCLLENKHSLEKYIGVIAITASVAPLLGLLGTVSGMIETFKMMTIFGTGDPSVVSGGISEALVTTELGLVVAIPALVINAVLLRRIKSYTHLLESMAIKLSKLDMPAMQLHTKVEER